MTGKPKDFFWAFIVGGVFSILCEGLWWLVLAMGVPAMTWAITVMLMILCAIGMIMTITGVMGRLVGLSGFGALLPLFTFPAVIIEEAGKALARGESLGIASKKALKGPNFLFSTGITFSVITAVAVFLAQGREYSMEMMIKVGEIEGTPMSLMLFINAFWVGGLVSLIWQIFFRINKQSIILNLCIGVYVGAILSGLGAMEHLVGFAGRAMVLPIIGLGEACYRWTMAILLFGDWSGCLRFLLLIAFVYVFGTVVFGPIYRSILQKTNSKQS